MNGSAPLVDWWPEKQFRDRPVGKVFVCGRKLHPPAYSHVVNFPRLEIPLHGCYKNQIENNGDRITVELGPGTALFAAPNCWNLPAWSGKLEMMSLLFGRKQLGISLVQTQGRGVPQLAAQKFSTPWPLTGALPHILKAMVELQSADGPQAVFVDLTRALVRSIQELLRHPETRSTGRAHGLLESVCIYLQNHYQYDITRDSVSRQFEVTPNHLSRLFQTHGNMTFSGYLTHVRIDRAKHLLLSYNLKLDEIAVRCGYRDTAYFCRVFKQLTKVTPAEYRGITRRAEAAR